MLSIRLGRVVDRVRVVETRLFKEKHDEHRAMLQSETNSLWNRIRLVDWSIRTFVAGALIVCPSNSRAVSERVIAFQPLSSHRLFIRLRDGVGHCRIVAVLI